MFAKFGSILDVVMHPNGSVFIIFSDIASAAQAEKTINMQYANSTDIRLVVTWCNQLESQFAWEKYKQNKILMAPVNKFQETYSPLISPSLSTNSNSSVKLHCDLHLLIHCDRTGNMY